VKHIISLGAGVQSSTMALMAAHGEITPMPDYAIFADTQAEPMGVYTWLDWLEKQLPFPVVRVSQGSLTDAQLEPPRWSKKSPDKQWVRTYIPAHMVDGDGELKGLLGRKCTGEFKIIPMRNYIRRELGIYGKQCKEHLVTQWLGISLDEIQRMKMSVEKWQEFRHPLIELRMTRDDCHTWMQKNGYPRPPRSACIYCPFRSNKEWRTIQENPKDFEFAVQFEKDLQEVVASMEPEASTVDGVPYLHSKRIPLSEVDFSDDKKAATQLDWLDECAGMCGV